LREILFSTPSRHPPAADAKIAKLVDGQAKPASSLKFLYLPVLYLQVSATGGSAGIQHSKFNIHHSAPGGLVNPSSWISSLASSSLRRRRLNCRSAAISPFQIASGFIKINLMINII